jgi:hypothetical protein
MQTKTALLGLLALFTLGAGVAPAGAANSDLFALWTCTTDTETRTLSIGDKEGGGCELHYEKHGNIKVISWSSHSTEPCLRSRNKIVDELKKAGWKCTKTDM